MVTIVLMLLEKALREVHVFLMLSFYLASGRNGSYVGVFLPRRSAATRTNILLLFWKLERADGSVAPLCVIYFERFTVT